MFKTRSVVSVFLGIVLVWAAAGAATGATTIGSNFDGIMSVIYDTSSGNLFIEHAPLIPPAVQRISIASAGGSLIPANLIVPVLAPPVTVTSSSTFLIAMEWSAGTFLGTSSLLGNILPPSELEATLLADLTIDWSPDPGLLGPGDLLYGTYGTTPGDPVPPSGGAGGFWRFFDVTSGSWFDPPLATGFTYTMTGGSKFTKLGLPAGYGTSFDVIVSGSPVATGLGEHDAYTFAAGGVNSFSLVGINPAVDAAQWDAFPLYLEFDTPTASFEMTAITTVPEPASLALLGLASACLLARRRR